jgi:hypothetical protein
VHLGISQFELAYHIAGIGRRHTESDNKDHPTRYFLASVKLWKNMTYPTRPKTATAEGSDRIPRDIVSAIMTEAKVSAIVRPSNQTVQLTYSCYIATISLFDTLSPPPTHLRMDSHREMVCDPILASLRYPATYSICSRWYLAICLGYLAPFRRADVMLAGFAV